MNSRAYFIFFLHVFDSLLHLDKNYVIELQIKKRNVFIYYLYHFIPFTINHLVLFIFIPFTSSQFFFNLFNVFFIFQIFAQLRSNGIPYRHIKELIPSNPSRKFITLCPCVKYMRIVTRIINIQIKFSRKKKKNEMFPSLRPPLPPPTSNAQ